MLPVFLIFSNTTVVNLLNACIILARLFEEQSSLFTHHGVGATLHNTMYAENGSMG